MNVFCMRTSIPKCSGHQDGENTGKPEGDSDRYPDEQKNMKKSTRKILMIVTLFSLTKESRMTS